LRDRGAKARLLDEQCKSGLKVGTHRPRSRWPVGCPPLSDALDLARCTPGDVKFKRHG
jgi:hypothetical protein